MKNIKRNLLTVLIAFFVLNVGNLNAQNKINVSVQSDGEKFDHFWSKCVGAGRANEALRAGWLEQMEKVQQNCGFEYVRFHGLFHDDMFPILEERGRLVYNWQYIDDVFDRLLDMNVRPFVELGFFPKPLAAENSKTQFWWKGNVTPGPEWEQKWHDFIKAFAQHVVDRYGIDEASSWYYEVWNEPNLYPAFLDAPKSVYFEMYKQSVLAIKSVDERLKVGGPSTSNFVPDTRFEGDLPNNDVTKALFEAEDINTLEWRGVWIEDFLKYCKKEKLPVDFITTHPYPTDYAFNPETGKGRGSTRYVQSVIEDLQWLQKTVKNSAYPDAEIHLTEWNTSPSSRDRMHDMLPAAAYIVKSNLDCIGLTNSLALWTFTDIFEEKGGAASIFHGGFGMINFQGLVKPSYHAYSLLYQLGDEKLYKDDFVFVSRDSGDGKVTVLTFNYPEENYGSVPAGYKSYQDLSKGTPKKLDLTLTDLKPGAQFKIEILDKDHGNVCHSWEKMGKPEPPTREQVQVLKEMAENLKTEVVTANDKGILNLNREIAPWNVILIKQIN